MCVLSDYSLHERLHQFFKDPDEQHQFVNPASVDIRIGAHLKYEDETQWDLTKSAYVLKPKEFVLISTYEHIMVPHDCAVELKLKSSRAREGFNHSLAFWVDPGWTGILTMEVMNVNNTRTLVVEYGMAFAQIIVHKLDTPVLRPYVGRYQGATSVEAAK